MGVDLPVNVQSIGAQSFHLLSYFIISSGQLLYHAILLDMSKCEANKCNMTNESKILNAEILRLCLRLFYNPGIHVLI